MKPPCFKKKYDFKSCVCQSCKVAFECGNENKNTICSLPTYLKNIRVITFLQILNKYPNITAKEIREKMIEKLGGKVNIFNYVNLLKKEGFIVMTIKGRKRVYRLA